MNDRFDRFSVDVEVRKNRRRRQIVVEQIVTGDLVVPHPFAGEAPHADECTAEQIVAEPMPPVHIVGRAREREIGESLVFDDDDQRPRDGVPGVGP